jgi:menaquinone-9 beta-reductase
MTDQAHIDDIFADAADHDGVQPATPTPANRVTGADHDGVRPATPTPASRVTGADHDVVIVGASLAGSAAAVFLARAGARVALVEKSPNPHAYKRICTHYIQASAVATLERLGLLKWMIEAGAVRSRARLWTHYGWIEPTAHSDVPSGVNLRREILDPMIRELAAETPGVELILGHTVHGLLREDGRVTGVCARDAHNHDVTLRARLVVGADGRDSRTAKLANVRTKTTPHGRFAYGGYFEGPPPKGAPDASLWLLDPDMAAAFPTDDGLTFYACMPVMERLPEFKHDPLAGLTGLLSSLPEAPPIAESKLVGQVQGKIDMTNVAHTPAAPGFALIGDAALAIDPLWGVGCGWALQSAEWLADSVAPALAGSESLDRGLRRYRRRHGFKLRGHAAMIYDGATGRKFNLGERALFFAASHDERVARAMERFATRTNGPARMFASTIPRTTIVNARHALRARDARADPVGAHAPS